jgi:hypothetical protein
VVSIPDEIVDFSLFSIYLTVPAAPQPYGLLSRHQNLVSENLSGHIARPARKLTTSRLYVIEWLENVGSSIALNSISLHGML